LSAHDDLLSRKTTTEYGHVRYRLAKTSKVPWTIGLKYYSISSSRALLPEVDKAEFMHIAGLVIFLSALL
jgi:hypothetical protein